MVFLVALVIMAIALAFVLYPLFQERVEGPEEDTGEDFQALQDRRRAIYEDIRDLDADYRLGNLDEADYRQLREQYSRRAVNILKTLDTLSGGDQELEEGIKKEVQALRLASSRSAAPSDHHGILEEPKSKILRRPSKSQEQSEKRCLSCGHPLEPRARFCSQCGEKAME